MEGSRHHGIHRNAQLGQWLLARDHHFRHWRNGGRGNAGDGHWRDGRVVRRLAVLVRLLCGVAARGFRRRVLSLAVREEERTNSLD